MNDEAVYRTAPATPGLLKIDGTYTYKWHIVSFGKNPRILADTFNLVFRQNVFSGALVNRPLGLAFNLVIRSKALSA